MVLGFLGITFATYQLVKIVIANALQLPVLSQIVPDWGWVFYALPMMCLVFSGVFGLKTVESYRNDRGI